jgi:steroid delta-isomerase-like uncharacterized protein
MTITSTDRVDARAILETFYRAFTGEPGLLDEVVTPDWQDIPLAPGQQPGPDGVKPMIRSFKQAVPDLAITVQDMLVDGDRLGARVEMTGTHLGEWFGVPASGRPFKIALHEFHQIKDGRLTLTWHLEDWFSWLNQVGAWPKKKENEA